MSSRRLVIIVAAHEHERPTLNLFRDFLVFELLEVLKDLPLLLFGAAEAVVLVLVLLYRRFWLRNLLTSLGHFIPVDFRKELVSLDFFGTLRACAEPPAWVSVEQVHDEVLGFERHAYWQLEDSPLDVVEELGPIKISNFNTSRHKWPRK